MKIIKITPEGIEFDNGDKLTYYHEQDCCEDNYANFEELLDTEAMSLNFKCLKFEKANGGFVFGDDIIKIYVPCYSIQNGYYNNNIELYLNHEKIFNVDCLVCDDDPNDPFYTEDI